MKDIFLFLGGELCGIMAKHKIFMPIVNFFISWAYKEFGLKMDIIDGKLICNTTT